MASTQDSTTATSDAERSIQSDRIASNLRYDVDTDATYYGASTGAAIPGLSISVSGSVIHYQSTDGEDFDLEAEDSRGDTFIFAFKGTTGDFKKLPPSAPLGFTIKVLGDNNKGQDDYYVRLISDESGGFVWKECLAPEAKIRIDASTMPHQLISEADGTFTLAPMTLKDRKVGDDSTNPFPSFIGETLSDVFFHRNRLGLLSGENVIFSEAGAFEEFNYFLKTTLSILDTDVIDVAVSNTKVSLLKHAVPFSDSLLLFSALTQFKLSAADLLTPSTVQINTATQFETSLRAKPVGAGRYVFFSTSKGAWSGVREYFVDEDTKTNDAIEITAHVPEYLPGTIKKLEASSNEDMLLALTSEAPNSIFVYRYYWQGNEKLQSAWSEWTFRGNVINVSFSASEIYILVNYNGTLCLERIDLSVDASSEETSGNFPVLLDRRVRLDADNLIVPYTDQNIVYITDKATSVTQESALDYVVNQGGVVFAGIPYEFRYVFSEQVPKIDKESLTTAKLKLRNMTVSYNDSGFFECIVRPLYREERVATFTGRIVNSGSNLLNEAALETGAFRFGILSSGDAEIEIRSESHLPVALQSATIEALLQQRTRQI